MELPLEIVFRDLAPSASIEEDIRTKAAKLDQVCDRIMSCRVVVEPGHRRHQQGNLFRASITVSIAGAKPVVVNRMADDDHAHEDPHVAIRDAFDAARRQLSSLSRRRQGEVKLHEEPPLGRVARLFPDKGYGFIEQPDGRELYFHRNSVLNDAFDELEVGSEIRFAEEMGKNGPQASTVRAIGRRHPQLSASS